MTDRLCESNTGSGQTNYSVCRRFDLVGGIVPRPRYSQSDEPASLGIEGVVEEEVEDMNRKHVPLAVVLFLVVGLAMNGTLDEFVVDVVSGVWEIVIAFT